MSGSVPHILILDADHTFARTLSRLLAENGYQASTLSSAEALPEYLATSPVDLLLVDLSLPGQHGFSVLEMLRRHHDHRHLPVLALTDHAVEETSVRALGLGASDVIAKPIRARELLARIRVHLRTGHALNLARAEARSQAALVAIHRELSTDLPPDELFQVLVRQVAAGLRIPRCSILLVGADRGAARVVAASENPILRDLPVDLARYPEVRRALDIGKALLIQDTTADPVFQGLTAIETTSALVLPFVIQGECTGAFYLRTGPGDPPLGEGDLKFAERVVDAAVAAIAKALAFQDTTRREAEMRQLAETDPLTRLLNRRTLDERLATEVDRARRYGSVLTCLMMDIDHFKQINDTHGHQVGDRILVQFADILRRDQRSIDVMARYGGEEFVALLPETGEAGAWLFAERLQRRVTNTMFGEEGAPVPVTISIGLATFPGAQADDGPALIRLADRNLLRAKGEGRNQVRG